MRRMLRAFDAFRGERPAADLTDAGLQEKARYARFVYRFEAFSRVGMNTSRRNARQLRAGGRFLRFESRTTQLFLREKRFPTLNRAQLAFSCIFEIVGALAQGAVVLRMLV